MKTYKTWEVIKMLSENNDLEFKTNIGNVSLKEIDDCKEMAWEEGTPFEINYYTLCYGWELIQEPVTFMEAINSSKRIKSEYMTDYDYVEDLMDSLSDFAEKFVLKVLNGKWFIKEEE